MERSNYLCWRSQFLDILDIYDLSSHVDASAAAPSEPLPDSSPNPAYHKWLKSDKLVLSWIKATVSSFVQTLLLPCKSTPAAWQLLDKRLSPFSKIHARSLRDQLRSLTKEPDQSIADFLLKAKSLSDSLASAGALVSETDLVDGLVDNLGPSYKEFVTSLHLRPTITFDDLYDLLLQKKISSLSASATALVASNIKSNQTSTSASSSSQSSSRGKGRGKGKGHW